MVFGTWTLRMRPAECSLDVARRQRGVVAADRDEMGDRRPGAASSTTACIASGDLVGFSRDGAEHRAAGQVHARHVVDGQRPQLVERGAAHQVLEAVADARSPRSPSLIASIVAAEMTALMPGAGPPPTRMPSLFRCVHVRARILSGARHAVNREADAYGIIGRLDEGACMPIRPLSVRRWPPRRWRWRDRAAQSAQPPRRPMRSTTWTASATSAIGHCRPTALDRLHGRLADVAKDRDNGDVWMSSWDGTEHLRLTSSPARESQPRWSPDGKWIAFLSGRPRGEDDKTEGAQVWLLSRQGGEARRLTDRKGGVSDVEWSPDSARLVLVGDDPDPEADKGDDDKTPRSPSSSIATVQARRRRLSAAPPFASLSADASTSGGRAAHHGRIRRRSRPGRPTGHGSRSSASAEPTRIAPTTPTST